MKKVEVSPEVVERLRKSAAVVALEDRDTGFACGELWASEDAEASDLRILENGGSIMDVAGDDGIEAFWDSVLGDTWRAQVTEDWISGFVDGAKAVWEEVQRRF